MIVPLASRSRVFPYTTLFRSPTSWVPGRSQFGTWNLEPFLPVQPVAEDVEEGSELLLLVRGETLVEAQLAEPVRTVPGSKFRSEEHTSELQSRVDLVCRPLLE